MNDLKTVLLIFSCSIVIFSCCPKQATTSQNRTELPQSHIQNAKKRVWKLRDRLPNCDSALVFMKNVIQPLNCIEYIEPNIPFDKRIYFHIPGERSDFYKTGYLDFYVNPDCLNGLSFSELLEIFCPPEYIEYFKKVDSEQLDKEYQFWVSDRERGVSIHFYVNNGIISRANNAIDRMDSH